MSHYFGKVLILKLLPLFNKILIFCFNLLVRHPSLLHCNLLESVCKVNKWVKKISYIAHAIDKYNQLYFTILAHSLHYILNIQ